MRRTFNVPAYLRFTAGLIFTALMITSSGCDSTNYPYRFAAGCYVEWAGSRDGNTTIAAGTDCHPSAPYWPNLRFHPTDLWAMQWASKTGIFAFDIGTSGPDVHHIQLWVGQAIGSPTHQTPTEREVMEAALACLQGHVSSCTAQGGEQDASDVSYEIGNAGTVFLVLEMRP